MMQNQKKMQKFQTKQTIHDEQSEENTEDGDEDVIPIPPGFSGYDHKEYDSEGTEKPTVPPDFVIVIE